jgi:hypothetical protein
MPANWDTYQNLSTTNRVEWPTGPMTGLNQGSAPRWVEAWVVQGGGMGPGNTWTGPSQGTTQSSWSGWVANRWTAAEPGWINGSFQPGPALGISLLALRNSTAGSYEYDWWFDVVVLY